MLPTGQWRERYSHMLNDLRSVLQQTLTEGADPSKGLKILQAMTPFGLNIHYTMNVSAIFILCFMKILRR